MKLNFTETDQQRHQRQQMLRDQIAPRGIQDQSVLRVLAELPRHLFVPPALQSRAYEDNPLPIGHDQTISQPYIVALMTQHLDLHPDHDVLEIGTGCGYQTAVLALLASQVYTIERIPDLAPLAPDLLNQLGITNVHYHLGDGTLGWPQGRSFDRIIVAAAGSRVPPQLWHQLRDGGKMVMPLGDDTSQQLYLLEKQQNTPVQTLLCHCRFVKLIEP